MKGKNVFNSIEIQIIEGLIGEKLSATLDKQKSIRHKIRKTGFYYSDFNSKREGYTIEDFRLLIEDGQIEIRDNFNESPISAIMKQTENKRIELPDFSGFNSILEAFKLNKFDPKIHSEGSIPNIPGNYIFCLKKDSKFPTLVVKPNLHTFIGLEVIYTGISSNSLRVRDFKQHFKGNNSGRSTVRKSLGVLLGYKQISRDKDPNSNKTKFNVIDEKSLSEWMLENLIMFFCPCSEYNEIEFLLINHFNPPLNLKSNSNLINREFRSYLSSLRNVREII